MRVLRAAGAAAAALLCTAITSAPAMACPWECPHDKPTATATPTPKPTPKEKPGKAPYHFDLNADCAGGTVSFSGWDKQFTTVDVKISYYLTGADGVFAHASGTFTDGAAKVDLASELPKGKKLDRAEYRIVAKGANSHTLAEYTGAMKCGAQGASESPAVTAVTTDVQCAGEAADGKVTVTLTRSGESAEAGLNLRPFDSKESAVAEWSKIEVKADGAPVARPFSNLAAGSYWVEVATPGMATQISRTQVEVPKCAVNASGSATTAPAPAPTASSSANAAVTKPGLANTGVRA